MIDIENPGGIAGLGRGEDTMLAHVAPGEMVVPPVLSPETQETIKQEMIAVGLDPNQYTVGDGMSINPITGMAEFGFLKKLGKSLKKVVKKVAPVAAIGLGIAGIGGVGPLGGLLGKGASGATTSKFFGAGGKFRTGLGGLFGGGAGVTDATSTQKFFGKGGRFREFVLPGEDKKGLFKNIFGGRQVLTEEQIAELSPEELAVYQQSMNTGPFGGRFGPFLRDTFLGTTEDPGLLRNIVGGGGEDGGLGGNAGLMALAALYGKAVKEDFKDKEGGLKDIRQSIRPDLMPAPTFTGFDLGIRPGMAEGGVITDPNNLPVDVKIKLENIYRKLYLANPEEDRNRRRADYTQLTEDERELHKQYLTGKLRRDAPLIAKYMDLIGFDNIGDDNPLLAGAKVASIALGLSGALPTSRIRRRFNPDAGILSDPIRDKALAERKEMFGYAGGGFMDEQELDLRMGGPSIGPGTGTSDDIPAMLSDGEFVMTSAANNGLGGFKITKTETGIELIPNGAPDRQKGAKNMDKLMKTFEKFNEIGKV